MKNMKAECQDCGFEFQINNDDVDYGGILCPQCLSGNYEIDEYPESEYHEDYGEDYDYESEYVHPCGNTWDEPNEW